MKRSTLVCVIVAIITVVALFVAYKLRPERAPVNEFHAHDDKAPLR